MEDNKKETSSTTVENFNITRLLKGEDLRLG